MAYSETLAARIRTVLVQTGDLGERKMFGGIAFMLSGHMICGVLGEDLMVRVGQDGYAAALARPHTRPMDFTGRVSTKMIYVAPSGCKTDKALADWIERGMAFVRTLPVRVARTRGHRRNRSQSG